MTQLDFAQITKNEARVLTGHLRGVAWRKEIGLDSMEAVGERIVVVAPKRLEAISPSFVQGFFADSVSKLGADVFERLYDFTLLPVILRDDLLLGIERLKLHPPRNH